MGNNPFVKPLKAFDPKKDLRVNEKFSLSGMTSGNDALSDLEGSDLSAGDDGDHGNEITSFKTGGPITSSIINIGNETGKELLLVSNRKGEIFILSLEGTRLEKRMKFRLPGTIIHSPEVQNGIIYCTTEEGGIYAINTGLGSEKKQIFKKPRILWQRRMKKGILTEAIATGRMLIVAPLNGMYGFEAYYQNDSSKAIGRPLWGFTINGVVSSPTLHGGTLYVGSEDNHLYAIEYGGSKARKIWTIDLSGAIRVRPCISETSNTVLVATKDGFVYCIDRSRGEYKWNFVVRAEVHSNITSAVIGNSELFLFGADNGFFYCVNAYGKEVWKTKTNGRIRTEALVHEGRVYFGSEDNHFYCLNLRDGKQIYTYRTDGNINGKPIIVNNIVFFGSTDSFVHGISP